jgi:hypothetical protein
MRFSASGRLHSQRISLASHPVLPAARGSVFEVALYRALAPLNDRLGSGPDPTDVANYLGCRDSTLIAGRRIVDGVEELHARILIGAT